MRKWMRQMARMLCLLLAVGTLVGCDSKGQSDAASSQQEQTMKIGMCFDTFTIERWLKDRDVFSATAASLGAEVNVQNANGDVQKQKEQLQRFIEDGVDAVVIIAVDESKLTEELEAAHRKGIKIIAYDRLINSPYVDLYISFDNNMVGQMMAESISECLNAKGSVQRNVLMICGAKEDRNVSMVEEGFRKIAETENLNIVDTFYADGWRAENVDLYFAENSQVLSQVDAIMCGNDSLAGEVIDILATNRMAGDVVVVGQDADLDACQRIVEGTQEMTVYKTVELMAKRAAELTIDLIQGTDLNSQDMDTIAYDGGEIPYVAMAPQAVTKENMDSVIIESGFHLKEDVYMNVGN